MELDEIKKLIEFLKDTDITELQIEREGAKIKVKREKFLSSFDMPPTISHTVSPESEVPKKEARDKNLVTITSPTSVARKRRSRPRRIKIS